MLTKVETVYSTIEAESLVRGLVKQCYEIVDVKVVPEVWEEDRRYVVTITYKATAESEALIRQRRQEASERHREASERATERLNYICSPEYKALLADKEEAARAAAQARARQEDEHLRVAVIAVKIVVSLVLVSYLASVMGSGWYILALLLTIPFWFPKPAKTRFFPVHDEYFSLVKKAKASATAAFPEWLPPILWGLAVAAPLVLLIAALFRS